jgi:hypothetical protein
VDTVGYEQPREAAFDAQSVWLFREKVGRELRRRYQDVVTQPVPERWLEILRRRDEDGFN